MNLLADLRFGLRSLARVRGVGIPIEPTVGRITFDEAAEDLLNDYGRIASAPSSMPSAESKNTWRRSLVIGG
jgi:hypothetical protein